MFPAPFTLFTSCRFNQNRQTIDNITFKGPGRFLTFLHRSLGNNEYGFQVIFIRVKLIPQIIICMDVNSRIKGMPDKFFDSGFFKGLSYLTAQFKETVPFFPQFFIFPCSIYFWQGSKMNTCCFSLPNRHEIPNLFSSEGKYRRHESCNGVKLHLYDGLGASSFR